MMAASFRVMPNTRSRFEGLGLSLPHEAPTVIRSVACFRNSVMGQRRRSRQARLGDRFTTDSRHHDGLSALRLRGHFQTWLACFLSEMATARFGEEHAFPNEVWLSPNPRNEPPTDPRGVIRLARKLHLKNSILRDSAIEQKRQAEDHNERGSEPRSECGSACRYYQNPGGVSGMADEGVGSRGDDVLAAVGLDANGRGEKP